MTKKAKQNSGPLKCELPPDEALKRAMLVKVPNYWTKPAKAKRQTKR